MKIRMLSTQKGSVDGIAVREYAAGTEHDLSGAPGDRALAAAFVGASMAVFVGASDVAAAIELAADEPGAAPDAPAVEAPPEASTKRPYTRKAK